MNTHTASQSFVPLFESGRRPPPGLSSSIWAPQPQPSDTTWSKAIESISRVHEDHLKEPARPEFRRALSNPTNRNCEDLFDAVGLVSTGSQDKRAIGAIGDGRKRSTPDYDPMHVHQLLRTLNLNSPAPLATESFAADFLPSPISPDVSPISTTSALLTPPDQSPAKGFGEWKFNPPYDFSTAYQSQGPNSLLFDIDPHSIPEYATPQHPLYRSNPPTDSMQPSIRPFPTFEPFQERLSAAPASNVISVREPALPAHVRQEPDFVHTSAWAPPRIRTSSIDWVKPEERRNSDSSVYSDLNFSPSRSHVGGSAHEPINFLSLLHPSASPPYELFVARIIKSSDQQASIFLQQKLKVADTEERAKIVSAICTRGYEMMAHRFGNWAVQRCLEAPATPTEKRKIVGCMRGRVVDLATNCYGCHVLQKALDCEEEIRLLIVSELLLGDPAQTLVNKHASHVWSKIMELTWTSPAPPIFAYVNNSLKGKWASLACHETGSLVVQHAFENLEESAKDGIVDELLNQGSNVFGEVAKSQWGSYCIQHILEHGSLQHRNMALEHLVSGLLEYATNEQGAKSVTKALKEGGKDTLDRIITRMCEPAKGGRRAMIVDLALSPTGSQLIATVLPNADKDQRALLYDSIRGHIVTLRGCKTGSKVIWLFDRMRAYYGY
ncbi:armadillo-type protein [Irpex rosettiformis]|uniref:Armadillo-type protein n=1 Tax=Irpex rosettiformis TaxID=378272 RepID=A0ACB8ULS4_9APHY|nr:armadillo-type protein [Irpex rosettiformis]